MRAGAWGLAVARDLVGRYYPSWAAQNLGSAPMLLERPPYGYGLT